MFGKFSQKVRKTGKGIIVNQPSGGTVKAMYYRDGNYPSVPKNPQKAINDYGVTEEQLWHHDLRNHRPDKVYDWID